MTDKYHSFNVVQILFSSQLLNISRDEKKDIITTDFFNNSLKRHSVFKPIEYWL